MLDGDLLDSLEFIARIVRNNQQPFGGLQLIFTGDFFQLPPVSRDKKSFQFCFESQSWKKCLNHFILLTKIHRQTENKLIELLNEVRFGEISPAGLTMLETLEQEPKFPNDGIEATQLYATNEEVNKINQAELAKLPYQPYFYSAIDWVVPTKQLPELLRGCLALSELQLKLNAQVMLIKNLTPQLVNGSQGIVVGFQEQKECKVNYYDWETKKIKTTTQTLILPIVKFTNGIKKVIELVEWKSEIPYTHIVQASRQQIPLVLSWAITIHKSQGQSIERLKIDCQNIFAKGQLYVALSRATSVKYLQVIGFKKNHIMFSHPKVNNFYQTLLENQTGTKDIVFEGKVISIKRKSYRQGDYEDLLRKNRIVLEIRVEPKVPYALGINSSGRDKIYYAWSDYGDLDIQEGKKYQFLIQKSNGWWQLEGQNKLILL